MNHLVKVCFVILVLAGYSSSAIAASKFKLHPAVDELLTGDPTRSVEQLTQASENGDAQATAYLAVAYNFGWGVPRDIEQAMSLAQSSADKGNAAASLMMWIENPYQISSSDLKKLKSKANKIAKKGDLLAMYYVAIASEQDADAGLVFTALVAETTNIDVSSGSFVNSKSRKYYQSSAARGFAPSMYRLALLYEAGQGYKEDTAQAVVWHQKAIERDYPPSKGYVGALHSTGTGVSEDIPLALSLLNGAADSGDSWSANWLGIMYKDGIGVDVDNALALKFFERGAVLGSDKAAENKDQLENQLANATRQKAYEEQRQVAAARQQRAYEESLKACQTRGPQQYAESVLVEARQILSTMRSHGGTCGAYVDGWSKAYYRWTDQHESFSSMMVGPYDQAWCSLGMGNKAEVDVWKNQAPGYCL